MQHRRVEGRLDCSKLLRGISGLKSDTRSLLQCGDGKGGNKDQKAKRGDEKHYLFLLNKDRVSCIANSEKTWMVPCPSASRNLDEKGTDGPFLLPRFVVRARRFCCFLKPPSSLRKDAKDWWCTKVRFRAALYKKEKEEIKRVYDVTLALKEGGVSLQPRFSH